MKHLPLLAGLQTLRLSDNAIGAAGAAALAPSLSRLAGLQTLDLSYNNIGADGAAALAPSLLVLTGLQTLYLGISYNNMINRPLTISRIVDACTAGW